MEIAAGFLLGLAGAYLFWKFQVYLKPQIRMPELIARGPSRTNADQIVYRLKVINNSQRQVINIKVRSSVSKLINVPNGKRSFGKQLEVSPTESMVLGAARNIGQPFGLSPVKVFVIKPCSIDVESELRNGSLIMVTLSATDAESGTTIVHRKTYTKNRIIEGDYESGLSLQIRKP